MRPRDFVQRRPLGRVQANAKKIQPHFAFRFFRSSSHVEIVVTKNKEIKPTALVFLFFVDTINVDAEIVSATKKP